MKKLILTAAFAAAVLAMGGCDGNNDAPVFPTPTIGLVGGDLNEAQLLTDGMALTVRVEAPATIAALEIEIISPLLDDETLGLAGLSTRMDLAAPEASQTAGFEALGFPYGEAVKGRTALDLDLSGVMPMLKMLCDANEESSDHRFALTVVDKANRSAAATLLVRYEYRTSAVSVEYAGDADLWANTATLRGTELPQGAEVQYRAKGSAVWIGAAADGNGAFRIEPVWEERANEAGLTVRTIKDGTGVFAATVYEFRAEADGETLASGEFRTDRGDAIPNGDMAGWSGKEYQGDDSSWDLTYPNPAGMQFWDSGNNPFLENPGMDNPAGPLCCENPDEKGSALLQARMALGMVFAPGNLFVGDFTFAGMGGTVSFGKAYGWTARPRALKFRYKAEVGAVDKTGSYDPEAGELSGTQDRSRIFAAVVDWTKQHDVVSGMQKPTGMWDPATMQAVDEGPILAYAEKIIAASTDEWTECEIPLRWYAEAGAKPAAENVSLVISCATSMRGDYLTGCSTNTMCVDDFEWVY